MREQITSLWEVPFLKQKLRLNKNSIYKGLSQGALVIVLAIILIQFFLIILSEMNPRLKHRLVVRGGAPLMGMQGSMFTSHIWPVLKWNEVMSGEWQVKFDRWINTIVPYRSKIVRIHNQVYYRFFSKSYMNYGSIVVGKNYYLYEWPYLEKYLNTLRRTYNQAGFDLWADDLQKLADFFNKRGQVFIYLVTPSKAAYFPEYLPACRQCDKNKTRPDYYMATSTLKKRGFKFIDGSKIILDLKKDLGSLLFPQGGIHWTSLGAALVAREIIKEIPKRYSIPPLKFSYQFTKNASLSDMDLENLANLKRPVVQSSPFVEVLVKPKPLLLRNKKPVKLAVVGGSFTILIKKILAESRSFDQIDFFSYFLLSHSRNILEASSVSHYYTFKSVDSFRPDVADAYEDLMKAEIVILEENEQNLRSNHFKALLNKTIGRVPIAY